ncbi:hypothetical protein F5890DRAFT_988337 [Lentinula detonsa]|uniref:Uncharacterized protein n=1 Tax=Lentinula detonsa TaxID=2804962 RepID=A0AA38PPE5_9AGAR|nr:hypothetical protein F5890DRAFT_988337 [Lentinula detonsa]
MSKGNVAAVELWVVESQTQDLEGLIGGFFGGRFPHPQSPFRPSPLSGHPTGASPWSYFPLVPSNADAMDIDTMDIDCQHRQHQSQLRSPSTRSQSSTSLPGTPFDEGGPGGYLTATTTSTTNGVQEMNGNGVFWMTAFVFATYRVSYAGIFLYLKLRPFVNCQFVSVYLLVGIS